MNRRLIDWLLEEDIMRLKDGIQKATGSVSLEADVPERAEADTTGFEDLEGFDELTPDIDSIPEGQSRGPLLYVAIGVGILLAVAAFGIFAPQNLVGPLASVFSPVRTMIHGAPPPSEPTTPAPPPAPKPLTGPATRPTAATGPVTGTVTAPTTAPSEADEQEPVEVAKRSAPEPQPTAKPAPKPKPKPKPKPEAKRPAPKPEPKPQYWIVAGPLDSAELPASAKKLVRDLQIESSKRTATEQGLVVRTSSTLPQSQAEGIASQIQMAGIPVEIKSGANGAVLELGPFADASVAEQASMLLMANGIQPQTEETQVKTQVTYLEIGPVDSQSAAGTLSQKLAKILGVKTGLKRVAP